MKKMTDEQKHNSIREQVKNALMLLNNATRLSDQLSNANGQPEYELNEELHNVADDLRDLWQIYLK